MNPQQIQGIYRALNIATAVHGGQVDKAHEPYIFHPIRVMLRGRTYEEQVVGILHDVLEDRRAEDVSIKEIHLLFGGVISDALHFITRQESETYENYIARCRESALARIVKRFDLEDNLDPTRLNVLSENIRKGLYKRYSQALYLLAQ